MILILKLMITVKFPTLYKYILYYISYSSENNLIFFSNFGKINILVFSANYNEHILHIKKSKSSMGLMPLF